MKFGILLGFGISFLILLVILGFVYLSWQIMVAILATMVAVPLLGYFLLMAFMAFGRN